MSFLKGDAMKDRLKILIVDDISQNIALLVDILENKEYNTTFAKNGKQAIERTKYAHPDLILPS